MEGKGIASNDNLISAPFEKTYNDGSKIEVDDTGELEMIISKPKTFSFVTVNWDKVSTYSIKVCYKRSVH